jgi:3-oxoacyl-[acyl-carrier-protein] synthase II
VTRVLGVGVLTGWGASIAALPEDARRAAGDRRVVAMPTPPVPGDRFRRATRECLFAVAAVEAALREAGLDRAAVAGPRTALVYVTAAAYGASNKDFIVAGARAPYFPYTAPSAVPAEVAIEFGLTGGYVILVGGAAAGIDALWQASTLLAGRRADTALVLAVETFEECADLWARGRWMMPRPLVEAAACAVLCADADAAERSEDGPTLERVVARRAGETLACAPLVALALARAAAAPSARVTGQWRGRRATIALAT